VGGGSAAPVGDAAAPAPVAAAAPAAGAPSSGGAAAEFDTGSAVSPGGSGAGAGIGNGGADMPAKEPSMQDHFANFGKRLGEAGKHLEGEKTATHVSISTHAD
jgi:hypothetical protein